MLFSNKHTRFFLKLALLACFSMLVACQQSPAAHSPDVLTQKAISADRKPVTVLVKHAFSIHAFERAVEEKFPNIDLIQVGNYTRDMGVTEYQSRLEHGDLTDLVMTWPLEVGESYWEDRLIDLSGFNFTSKYHISMLNRIARNGKLHYLPGPSQVRGIIYNKTLFQENGWALPTNFDEFVSLCETIEASGIRSLQLGLANAEVLDTAFVGFGYADCYSKPQDSEWISAYNEGTGNFADHFGPALDTFQTLIDRNILQKDDLSITYSQRETMLFTRKCAMVEDSVLLARMGHSLTGTTDEFALMPFFNPGEGQDWARLYMVCYVGMGKHLLEAKNKETYDLALQLMEYISTPEGQEALMADTGGMFSSLLDVPPPNTPETQAMSNAFLGGRQAIFPTLKNAQPALRKGLAAMVRGELTAQQVCAMVDAENLAPAKSAPPVVLATATADFSLIETGRFVAEALRTAGDCEIGLFLDNGKDGKHNGKGISAKFYRGDVTDVDISRVLPDLRQGDPDTLWKVTMTGADLIKTLEYSIVVNNDAQGWFYYPAGLRMGYDPTAQPGSRLRNLRTSDDKAIDPTRVYSIAVMGNSVPEAFVIDCEKTDRTVTEILTQALITQKSISPMNDGHFILSNLG